MDWTKCVSIRAAPARGGYGGYIRASLYEIHVTRKGKLVWQYAHKDTGQATSLKKVTKWGMELAQKHNCVFHGNLGSLHNVEISEPNLELLAQLTLKENHGHSNQAI